MNKQGKIVTKPDDIEELLADNAHLIINCSSNFTFYHLGKAQNNTEVIRRMLHIIIDASVKYLENLAKKEMITHG